MGLGLSKAVQGLPEAINTFLAKAGNHFLYKGVIACFFYLAIFNRSSAQNAKEFLIEAEVSFGANTCLPTLFKYPIFKNKLEDPKSLFYAGISGMGPNASVLFEKNTESTWQLKYGVAMHRPVFRLAYSLPNRLFDPYISESRIDTNSYNQGFFHAQRFSYTCLGPIVEITKEGSWFFCRFGVLTNLRRPWRSYNPIFQNTTEFEGQLPSNLKRYLRITFAEKHKHLLLTYFEPGCNLIITKKCSFKIMLPITIQLIRSWVVNVDEKLNENMAAKRYQFDNIPNTLGLQIGINYKLIE